MALRARPRRNARLHRSRVVTGVDLARNHGAPREDCPAGGCRLGDRSSHRPSRLAGDQGRDHGRRRSDIEYGRTPMHPISTSSALTMMAPPPFGRGRAPRRRRQLLGVVVPAVQGRSGHLEDAWQRWRDPRCRRGGSGRAGFPDRRASLHRALRDDVSARVRRPRLDARALRRHRIPRDVLRRQERPARRERVRGRDRRAARPQHRVALESSA